MVALVAVAGASLQICSSQGNADSISSSLVHQIAIVDADDRKTEAEYAAEKNLPISEIQKRFAATGVLSCRGNTSSGQLTHSNSIVTTAAHTFYDPKTCATETAPESCIFTVKVGGVEKSANVLRLLATGYKCPQTPAPTDDWAVLHLTKPINDVEPYAIPMAKHLVESQIWVVGPAISVSGSSDFFRVNRATGKKEFPKSIEDCALRKAYWRSGKPVLFDSDCDSGEGNSGGSLLRRMGSKYVLIGVTKSNNESAESRKSADQSLANKGPYVQGKWATYFVPVANEFLMAIESAVR